VIANESMWLPVCAESSRKRAAPEQIQDEHHDVRGVEVRRPLRERMTRPGERKAIEKVTREEQQRQSGVVHLIHTAALSHDKCISARGRRSGPWRRGKSHEPARIGREIGGDRRQRFTGVADVPQYLRLVVDGKLLDRAQVIDVRATSSIPILEVAHVLRLVADDRRVETIVGREEHRGSQ
jgi:hypothetical protein